MQNIYDNECQIVSVATLLVNEVGVDAAQMLFDSWLLEHAERFAILARTILAKGWIARVHEKISPTWLYFDFPMSPCPVVLEQERVKRTMYRNTGTEL